VTLLTLEEVDALPPNVKLAFDHLLSSGVQVMADLGEDCGTLKEFRRRAHLLRMWADAMDAFADTYEAHKAPKDGGAA
jgi:hypothetical protein